ncbi:Octopamine receptor, partial [Stegodyphus mimosarum]
MVYVYCRIFAVARRRQAVLMQDTGSSKENQGSDSNSSTMGDTTVQADHQRILKDASHLEPEDVPMAQVRGSNERRSSFSIMRSTPFSLSRQSSYNPNVTTKLYQQQQHHHHESSEWQQQEISCDNSTSPKNKEDSGAVSPTGYRCQYCNPQKESKKTTRMTIRKKDGYERAAFQRERKVAKSLSVVVGGFVVCWLPFFIVYLIEPFCKSCFFHPTLTTCLVWLGWVNSAINPFIYALNNKDFKKAFLRLTIDKCRCCRKTRKGHDPQQFI